MYKKNERIIAFNLRILQQRVAVFEKKTMIYGDGCKEKSRQSTVVR